MSVASHIAALRKRHEELEKKIESELRSPGSDDLAIAEMKRRKLHIKEEIARLQDGARPD